MTGPAPWMMLPFALLLAAMALGPLLAEAAWARHHGKIALGLGLVTVGYCVVLRHEFGFAAHIAHDYVSFLCLVGSLFVVSGGIHIRVKGEATPAMNVLFLLLGAVAANALGTTGASMLLIRPWIRMNKYRITGYHIVFFIFLVANVGGSLSAVGDPPLFIGYLQGVPFWWITRRAWPVWLLAVSLLLAAFYALDRRNYRRAPRAVRQRETAQETWRFEGLRNLAYLAIVLAAIAIDRPLFLRELVMTAAAVASYFSTPKPVHQANHFNLAPVREVAVLFAGIFATMIPVLDWLNANAGALLGPRPAPGVFYWSAGGLSSVLDNAPTYLAFFSALSGSAGTPGTPVLLAHHGPGILAISLGAVFFGGATYIGNGPNFMIKSVADHQGVRTPTFLGFVSRYTVPFLLPVLIAVWLLFFRA